MFAYNLTYQKPLEEVDAFLSAHRAFLDEQYQLGHFICSGVKTPRIGGFILVNLPDLATAKSVMEQDPFYQNGIAKYELIEFTPSKYAAGFSSFVE